MKFILRRMIMICAIIALVLGFVVLQRPSQSTESAVVFSNQPASNDMTTNVSPIQYLAVIFDVPAGPDFQINSLRTPLNFSYYGIWADARIYADNAGTLGPLVVDLGSQSALPYYAATVIFTPVGAATLANGGRYWLVLSSTGGAVSWYSANPPIVPTGVFSFVDNGTLTGGTFASVSTQLFNFTLDADPIAAPPSGGGGVTACTNTDNRINPICEEPWQTAAIYCRPDGAIDVYGITDSEGWLAFRTTQVEIDAIGIPTQNSLIEASDDGKIRLYRLTTGEFQVNAPLWDEVRGNLPDGYVFTWGGCH